MARGRGRKVMPDQTGAAFLTHLGQSVDGHRDPRRDRLLL